MRICLYVVIAQVLVGASTLGSPPQTSTTDKSRRASPLTGIDSVATWRERAKELRHAWGKILGRSPDEVPPPRLVSLEVESDGVLVRQKVEYTVLPGERVLAFFLWRRDLEPASTPGVVVFHSTNPAAAEQPAGRADRPSHHLGLLLARAGFVVLAPRCYIFAPGRTYLQNTQWLLRRYRNWTGMGRMLWDGSRAIDILRTHPCVDRDRIGVVGHSLGAKEVLYVAAFDERVGAAVFSEGGIGLHFSNWDAPWYLGPQVKASGFEHDHDELLALIAPRPFLLIGGNSADGEKSRPYVERARAIYALYGAGQALQLINHGRGHSLPPEARCAIVSFLDRWLRGKEAAQDELRPGRTAAVDSPGRPSPQHRP